VLDDFREAYYWLRRNTADDAKVRVVYVVVVIDDDVSVGMFE
jgi:hypothetical protein